VRGGGGSVAPVPRPDSNHLAAAATVPQPRVPSEFVSTIATTRRPVTRVGQENLKHAADAPRPDRPALLLPLAEAACGPVVQRSSRCKPGSVGDGRGHLLYPP
jgi:hypothetical protein